LPRDIGFSTVIKGGITCKSWHLMLLGMVAIPFERGR
jgi:hypothetical protein